MLPASPQASQDFSQAVQFDAPPLQASQAPKCINGGTLLSVQCCADAQQSCAKSRVVGMELAKAGLRGTLPAPVGNLQALQSLVLHDNYLTGVRRVPVALHVLRPKNSGSKELAGQGQTLQELLGRSTEHEELSATTRVLRRRPPSSPCGR